MECSLSWMPSPDITRFPCPRLTRKNSIHNAKRPLLLQSHAIRTQKRWRHLSETDDKDFKPLIGHTVEYGMKLNLSKCFGVSAGKFLGFMVSQRGIEVSPDQVKAVMETPPHRSKKELQRLMGKLVH
ncbi:hypothetical protein CK203_066313 [Vitis vinifera]|uniref:Retrovirus-related Pol polyprotein from transposon opus n=1 Tax=Vitis vinifera TaxID=29760 RepID=A0A438FPB4_VITVI|nr:hypothetical protein CK203_066313 [Vitis vinifera]